MTNKKTIVLSGAALAVFLTVLVVLLLRARAPAFDDSDLKLVRSTIANNENAFFYLDQAGSNLYWPESKEKAIGRIAEEADWDTELESELLSENQSTLAYFEKALKCSELQVPALKGFAEDYPYLTDWKRIGRIASIQAANLFRQGKQKEGFDLAMKIVRLGHMMEDSHGPIIHYLVGSAVKAVGLKRLRQMTTETVLSPKQLISYIQKLESYKANQPGLTNAFKVEYEQAIKMFEDLQSGKSLGTNAITPPILFSMGIKPVFSLSKTKAVLLKSGRASLKSIPLPFSEVPLRKLTPQPTNQSVMAQIFSGNAVGNMLLEFAAPSWENALARKCQNNVTVSAIQLVIALKSYHTLHGALPESLDELVPDFISAVPLDDFDGKPLRYSKEKRLIWSVGKDLIDSGGQEFDQKKQKLDLPFRIEF